MNHIRTTKCGVNIYASSCPDSDMDKGGKNYDRKSKLDRNNMYYVKPLYNLWRGHSRGAHGAPSGVSARQIVRIDMPR